MEINVSIYCQHPDKDTNNQLQALFEHAHTSDRFVQACSEINPKLGAEHAQKLLAEIKASYGSDFSFDDVEPIEGVICCDKLCGSDGPEFATRVVRFIHKLSPDTIVQAWGTGDEDPWEFWLKMVDGRLARFDNQPIENAQDDETSIGTIYRWWHQDLPKSFKIGYLYDDDALRQELIEDYEEEYGEKIRPVTEDDYQQWLEQHFSDDVCSPMIVEGVELDDELADAISSEVTDEMAGMFTDLLSGLFGGGSRTKSVDSTAFDVSEMTDESIRLVFDDVYEQTKKYNTQNVMRHYAPDFEGEITNLIDGKKVKTPITKSLYKMSLNVVLKPELEYVWQQTIEKIVINDSESATVIAQSDSKFVDPISKQRKQSVTCEQYELAIVDGKIQITRFDIEELSAGEIQT